MSERENTLKEDALTIDDIHGGEKILCWKPGDKASVRHLEVCSAPYVDEENDFVVRVRERGSSQTHVVTTSSIGLTNERHSEEWTAIAILDDQIE